MVVLGWGAAIASVLLAMGIVAYLLRRPRARRITVESLKSDDW